MKIKRIVIDNFKSISHLEFEPTTLISALVGENGRGKTAFKEAFYAGLTGDFPANAIRNGCDFCSIEMTLDDGTIFSRIQSNSKPNKVVINGKASTAKALSEILYAKTGITKETMKIVASTNVIEDLEPAAFGNFISKYLPEKLTFSIVKSHISFISPDAIARLQDALPKEPATFGLEKLTETYNDFVEKRKFAKKELSNIVGKINASHIEEPKRTVAQIEADLNDVFKKEGGQKAAEAAMKMYNTVLKQKEIAEKNLAELKAKIDAMTVIKPRTAALDEIKTRKEEVTQKLIEAQTLLKTFEENIRLFKNTIENLNKPICPISEKLVCTTDKTKIKAELEEVIASNIEGCEIQKKTIANANAAIASLNNKETEFYALENAYKEKIMLVARYEEQKKNVPTLPPKPEEVLKKDYTTEIANLRKERDNAVAWNNLNKDKAKMEELVNETQILETLCDILNSKGDVMKSIMSYYMGAFETICNTLATKYRAGFEFKFIADEGVSYIVKPSATKDFTAFENLSSGEKLLALFIVANMLNELTNVRLLMLDDLDKLDANAFDEFIKLLNTSDVNDKYDHIILCAVNHPDTVNTLKKHPVTFVYPI